MLTIKEKIVFAYARYVSDDLTAYKSGIIRQLIAYHVINPFGTGRPFTMRGVQARKAGD